MGRVTVSLACIFLMLLGDMSTWQGHSGTVTALAISKHQDKDDTCTLSIVVPKDSLKSSCNGMAKLQRRLNAMELRADVYCKQVIELQEQLDKQASTNAERLAKIEAQLDIVMGDTAGETEKERLQLSKRTSLLERTVNQLQEKLALSGGSGSMGRKIEGDDDNSMFNKISLELPMGAEDRWMEQHKSTLESIIKPIVQAEVDKLFVGLKAFVKELVFLYNQVYISLIPPMNDVQATQGQSDRAGFDLSDDVTVDNLIRWTKLIPDSSENQVSKNIEAMTEAKLTATEKKLTAADDTSKQVDLSIEDLSTALLLSDDLTDTNDSFSGETPDLNATRVLDSEVSESNVSVEDSLTGSVRIGLREEAIGIVGNQNKSDIEGEEKNKSEVVRPREEAQEMSGWVRDAVSPQPKTEAWIKSQIRNMLTSTVSEIIKLVERRTGALHEQLREQSKLSKQAISRVEPHLESLSRSSESLELRVKTLDSGLQGALSSLDRLHGIDTAVEELKKNFSISQKKLIRSIASRESGVSAKTMDEQAKRVKKLERLVGVFQQTMEHDRNKTRELYRKMEADVAIAATDMKERTQGIVDDMARDFTVKLTDVNDTLWDKYIVLQESVERQENNEVLLHVEIARFGRRVEDNNKRTERELQRMRDNTNKYTGRNREMRRKIDRLEGNLVKALNETSSEISELKIDFRLNMNEGWIPMQFDFDASCTGCFGDQYVRLSGYKKPRLVGVVLCSKSRYKIFLANSRHEKFVNIGDRKGFGADHCEFVGGRKDASYNLSPLHSNYDSRKGYARANWGDKPVETYINAIKPTPLWYECGGVTIP